MTSHGRQPDVDRDAGGNIDRRRPEVWLLGAMGAFGIIVGAAYWFITYESAGSVLLAAFGLASAVGAALTWRQAGGDRRHADEPETRQLSGWAPLIAGLGVAVLGLGLIFGPALIIPGALIAVTGGRAWLAAVDRDRTP